MWSDIIETLATDATSFEKLEKFKWETVFSVEAGPFNLTRDTMLHELAKDVNLRKFQSVPERPRLRVLGLMIKETIAKHRDRPAVLYAAIGNDNLGFLGVACGKSSPPTSRTLLAARDAAKQNWFHFIFNETVAARDDKNNTAIHYVPITAFGMILKADAVLLEHHAGQFNTDHHSPLVYFQASMVEAKAPMEETASPEDDVSNDMTEIEARLSRKNAKSVVHRDMADRAFELSVAADSQPGPSSYTQDGKGVALESSLEEAQVPESINKLHDTMRQLCGNIDT
ncbi:hypothetical protein F5Y17DRAFT_475089 [Xylariaceae sp. FL0594]|nr:hypothetical protein F5Y17DRAFT_475089 [Xylariaceae sp. FL0594]